jgi:hypothetical protein
MIMKITPKTLERESGYLFKFLQHLRFPSYAALLSSAACFDVLERKKLPVLGSLEKGRYLKG